MLIFNIKLFIKIAAAILSGTSVSSPGSVSADTNIKYEPIQPAIETVYIQTQSGETLDQDQLNEIYIDTLKAIIKASGQKTPLKNTITKM